MNREERRRFARTNGGPMPPPDPAPQSIQFAPVPLSTVVQGGIDTADGPRILMVCTTPQGPNGYFLSPEHAKHLAGELHKCATAAASGLEIIGNLGEPTAGTT